MKASLRLASRLVPMLLLAASASAGAQTFPTKPIRIVAPYSAGGTIDAMARILQDPLSNTLGQPVIIENKAGAAGAIGTADVARAPADGYTLVLGNNGPHSILPAISKQLPYDGLKDFTPVSLLATTPLLLIVNHDVPASDLKSFIEFAQQAAKPLAFSTSGVGAVSHLTTEAFARQAGFEAMHVPYKGQAPTLNAVATGEVSFAITSPSSTVNAFVDSNKVKVLGVTTPEPSPVAPGVPTIASVVPGFQAELWYGLLAPANTAPEIIAKLNAAVTSALADPGLVERYENMGAVVQASTPAALADLISTEMPKWAEVVKNANIRIE
ncbi:MAG: tripartite tricarboxylate transporter substrate-binding protein [Pigmentiphaga sp.]|nr:tripartite tricarboxylate transporter substrate-binding protein [Pigmentiphaga sp.]